MFFSELDIFTFVVVALLLLTLLIQCDDDVSASDSSKIYDKINSPEHAKYSMLNINVTWVKEKS